MSLRSEVIRIINELNGNSKKITELPDADTPLSGSELFEVVQDGISKKVAKSDVSSGGSGGSTPTGWDHVSQGGDPTNLTLLYYSTDATESVYPLGTLFWSNGAGGWFTK